MDACEESHGRVYASYLFSQQHLKAFLLGTFHGVTSKYLQEYLNEFYYR